MSKCRFVPLAEALLAGFGRMSPRLLHRLADASLFVAMPLLEKRARIVRRNLELCFPALDAAQRERLVRDNLRETARGAFDLLRAWYAGDDALADPCDIRGLEHLRAAREQGRGVLLLCSHFTHAELALRLLRKAGVRGRAMVRGGSRCSEELMRRGRSRIVEGVIGKNDVRGAIAALARGELVAYLGDQDARHRHAFAPFFGVQAATFVAAPDIAARGNALLLPLFSWRDVAGTMQLRIGAPWQEQGAEFAARYMRELEAVVREHPAQYLWMHRRFKTRPQGNPSLY